MKRFLGSLLIAAILFAFIACNGNVDERLWGKKVSVTFVSNGGSPVATLRVKKGSVATKPQTPSYGSFVFKGWFSDDGKLFDFSTPLTSDITLFANWEGVVESRIVTQSVNPISDNLFTIKVSPASLTSDTTINIPANALTGSSNSSSELSVVSYAIEVAPTSFTILNLSSDNPNNLAVAGLDCKFTVNGTKVTDFNAPLTVTTYIVKGLSSVQVVYKGADNKSQPKADTSNTNIAHIWNTDSEMDRVDKLV